MADQRKNKVLTDSVKSLFNTIDASDVLFKEKNGVWYLGERKLVPAQLKQIAEEAEIIERLHTWKEIETCIKYLTNRKMFLESQTADDLIVGKAMLYTLKTINDILTVAKSLKT